MIVLSVKHINASAKESAKMTNPTIISKELVYITSLIISKTHQREDEREYSPSGKSCFDNSRARVSVLCAFFNVYNNCQNDQRSNNGNKQEKWTVP